jgi:hypothetical protein
VPLPTALRERSSSILPILDMEEFGVDRAAAVLIDATIIRGVLLPARM